MQTVIYIVAAICLLTLWLQSGPRHRLAYLKAHWPAELLCARLATHGGFHHQAIYLAETGRLGIEVRPPHVNHSRAAFTLSPDNILWMGLRQVRDLRRTAIKTIITAQRQQPFTDLRDLLARGTEALKAPSP